MDATEDGRRGAVRQWMTPQPIVPSLVFAGRHAGGSATRMSARSPCRTRGHHLRTTKVLPPMGPARIDPVKGTRDSLNVFPGESTS
ncbi:hypothetical protein ERT44_04335 [Stenotrophomonas sp. MA5]|nr:hypothetical protein [Stenotrophomonas maltophilia]RXK69213.1 hypothetical protein ERT44_04335 [Stenotrophomonas sp. MA5]